MPEILLFITGVLAGLIAGFLLSRRYSRPSGPAGSNERLLEERLLKADQGLERFSAELESQKAELRHANQEVQDAREKAAISTTQLEATQKERDALLAAQLRLNTDLDAIRQEKERLSRNVGEINEQLKAQIDLVSRIRKENEELQGLQSQSDLMREQLRVEKEALSNQAAETAEQLRSRELLNKRLEAELNELKSIQLSTIKARDDFRSEKEALSKRIAEVAEQLRSQESQTKFLEQARADLLAQFRALSGQMLDGSREALLKTTKETVSEPFSKQVELLRKQVEELTKDSTEKLGVLAQTTRDLRQRSEDVQGAAQQLTSALRSPNVKGRWGEVNLRRILEFVGLIAYCDFDEQVHVGGEDGTYRPDCVITIPGARRLIIDSKAPIESYLDAIQTTDETAREAALSTHLRKVRSHIDGLSKKDYASKIGSAGQVVDGVVLFIPVEGALSMALERDPDLLEYAFSKNIILTFPTSLLAILKGLSMTIQQAEIANNIDEIQRNAAELYKRFVTFTDKFNSVGSNLNRLNKAFNDAVGSYERRLIPQGRKFAELAGQNPDITLTDSVDSAVRELQSSD
jgi:DNA recombination protein RmuC